MPFPDPLSFPAIMIPRSTIIVLAAVASICVGALIAPPRWSLRLAAEDGLVEVASLVVLGVALILAIRQAATRLWPGWLSGAVMFLWGLLRELDIQKRFTYRSIESIGY